MTTELFAIEEAVEDAVAEVLAGNTGGVKVYKAWDAEKIMYPCAVIYAEESSNVEESEYNGIREVGVKIGVMVEARRGATTARADNKTARNAILAKLHDNDLVTALNATGHAVFSMAMVTTATRGVEEDRRILTTDISLQVIASLAETTTTTTTNIME
jgi:hypothetical protein